jgi:hypothetical protein
MTVTGFLFNEINVLNVISVKVSGYQLYHEIKKCYSKI